MPAIESDDSGRCKAPPVTDSEDSKTSRTDTQVARAARTRGHRTRAGIMKRATGARSIRYRTFLSSGVTGRRTGRRRAVTLVTTCAPAACNSSTASTILMRNFARDQPSQEIVTWRASARKPPVQLWMVATTRRSPMTERRAPLASLPFWPRYLSREEAARYVGVGPDVFDDEVNGGDWPQARRRGGRRGRLTWDRLALDAAADRDSGIGQLVDPDAPGPNLWRGRSNGSAERERN